MAPQDHIIRKLCQDDFTRTKAKAIYDLAFQRTGRETGNDLGRGHIALVQVCAFLASESTGKGEVTQEAAQSSASVDAKTFEAAVEVVRRVTSQPSGTMDLNKVSFALLVRLHKVREDAGVAMLEVADALRQRGAFDNTTLKLGAPAVQCAIFRWVCTKVFKLIVPDSPAYQSRYKVTRKSWTVAWRLLETHCTHMLDRLIALAQTASPSTRTRDQTHTEPHPSTPSRKRRATAHLQDEYGGDAVEVIVVQPRKKAARAADTAAWDAQRPKPAATPAQGSPPEKQASSNDMNRIYSTPMTSTGMSDVFSDSPARATPARPPRRTRFRLHSPAAASSEDEEEMPRRRRRNLHAPFLDRAAYAWRPSATLERGRKLEALMISKYGDPWDEL